MFNVSPPQQKQSPSPAGSELSVVVPDAKVNGDSEVTKTATPELAAKPYPDLLELHHAPQPQPREWFIDGFVPADSLTILSGDGGLGKSYLALYMAHCIAKGEPFMSRDVKKGNVLWMDAEGLGKEENTRRSFQLVHGLGEEKPSKGIFYFQPEAGIGEASVHKQLLYYVKHYDIKMVILDSLSIGAAGDMKEQRDVTPMLRGILRWGTVVAIDHITKSGAKGNQKSASIFGSVFKRNIARSTLKLVKSGSNLELSQDKNNYGQQSPSVRYNMAFSETHDGLGKVSFSLPAEIPNTGTNEQLSETVNNTLLVIRDKMGSASTFSAKDLSDKHDLGVKQTREHLKKLVKSRLVEKIKNGVYQLVDSQQEEAAGQA